MVAGAYIRLIGGNIELHAPGKIDFKAGSYPHGGPTSMAYPMPAKMEPICIPCLIEAAKNSNAFIER